MSRRVLLPLIVLLSGCGGGDASRPALRVDLVGTPQDAASVVDAATGAGLVTLDSGGSVVAALASSWRLAGDGRSVIFRLKPRRWGNGRAITARDVVASFRRLGAGRLPARALLAGLANGDAVLHGRLPAAALGIDAPVDNVVEVRSAGALTDLLALLAQPGLAVTGPDPLGPYRLAAKAPAAAPQVLVPAASAPPGTAQVTLTPAGDGEAAVARFAHARTDLVIGSGMGWFDEARLLASGAALRVEPTWGVYGYLVRPAGSLADPGVRRALAMAIDRDDLGSRLFGVALPPVDGPVPPLPGTPPPAEPDWAVLAPAARLDLARQLLAAAGFDTGHPLSVVISLPEGHEHAAIASEVAADWARIGVQATSAVRSPADHAAAVARGDYQLALVERTTPLPNAIGFLAPFACGAGAYCNAAADAFVATARTAADPAAANAALTSAEAAMVADTPLIAVFAPLRWALVSPRVTGWTANAAGAHPLAGLRIAGRAPRPLP